MKLSKFEAEISTSTEPTLMRRAMRRIARLLLQPLALAIALQPAAFAAPNPSLLAQLPKYMDSTAASNTVFVMDDSQSMLMMELPTPPGIAPAGAVGPMTFALEVTPRPLTGTTTAIAEKWQWILRSPTINPAYYNPTITYKPWNYDGLVEGVDALAFKKSDIAIITEADGFRRGKTPHDARFTSAATPTLAWPNHLGAGARAKDEKGNTAQYFIGAAKNTAGTWGGQDIFSRPMIRTICEQCSVPATPAGMQCAPHTDCSGTLGAWVDVNFGTLPAPAPRSCAAAVESGFVNKGPDARWYCAIGTLSTPAAPVACTAEAFANFQDGNLPFCCPGGAINTACTTVTNCPAGQTCPTVGRFVTKPNELVIAHYFRYDGDINGGGKNNAANYKLVELERYKTENADGTGGAANDHLYPLRTIDGVEIDSTNAAVRPECTSVVNGNKKACTWAQEAQNFANWYTYYRLRLFSAVAVTAEALSELTSDNLLDSLRLGYGSTNYFNGSANPYGAVHPWDLPTAATPRTIGDVDATAAAGFVSNEGTLTRGVREFRQGTVERTQVFNWLFSLRPQGATPSREALDSVGRYFSRRDALGPWSDMPGGVPAVDSRPVDQHASCRRSYAILVTDGEWTRTAGGVQPLLENRGAVPAWVASQSAATPLNAASVAGPTHNDGVGLANGEVFPPAAGQPQFSTVTGNPTGTLADAAYYWWSRDLRPDVDNGVRPLLTRLGDAPERVNESFWQNVTPFIVGYGLTATMDTTANRDAIIAGTAVTWPIVNTDATKVRDSDCGPGSGCGRVNDAFRAARMARGDFFAATDIGTLAKKVAQVLASINEVDGSASAYTGRSATLKQGDYLYSSKFTTSSWTGSIEAYDAIKLNESLLNGTAPPTPVVAKIPAYGARNIFTSKDVMAGGTTFAFGNLSAAQQALVTANAIDWMRGNQSVEARNGGTLRNRDNGEILGDIINSNPLFSGAADARYTAYRHPAASKKADGSYATTDYPAFVAAKNNFGIRNPTIFAGANDGMLHAFKALTPTNAEISEIFAYVPRAVYPELASLVSTGYVHKYYVDGPVVEGDVYINNKWRTVLVGTNGAGPTGVFALDVTQLNDNLSAAKPFGTGDVLWDIAAAASTIPPLIDTTRANIDDLGHITHPGVIGSGLDGEWYYFTGNGWESKTDKASLLAIRIRDGEIFKIATDDWGGTNVVGADPTTRPNGLGGVAPVYDGNRNIVGIYAGDRAGRLWKFDLTSNNRNAWKAEKILFNTAEQTDATGVSYRQPISAAPIIVAHPNGGRLIILGTGRLTESTDISDLSVQSIYAIWEQKPNQVTHAKAPTFNWPLNASNLHEITLSETKRTVVIDGQPKQLRTRFLDRKGFYWGMPNKEGWRLDLKTNVALGERVIVSPSEQGGFVNVSTFEPVANGDKCQGGGASFLYRLDVAQTFKRFALNNANTDIVGEELGGGTVGGTRLFGTGNPDANGVITTLNKDQLKKALNGFGHSGGPGPDVGAKSACATTAGARTIANKSAGLGLTQCPAHAQRVWRELPRGAQ